MPASGTGTRALPLARLDVLFGLAPAKPARTGARRRRRGRGTGGRVRRRRRGGGLGPPRQAARRLGPAPEGDLGCGRGPREERWPSLSIRAHSSRGSTLRRPRGGWRERAATSSSTFRPAGRGSPCRSNGSARRRVRAGSRRCRGRPLRGAAWPWFGARRSASSTSPRPSVSLPRRSAGAARRRPLRVRPRAPRRRRRRRGAVIPQGRLAPPPPGRGALAASSRRKGASSRCSTSTASGRGTRHERRTNDPARRAAPPRPMRRSAGRRQASSRRSPARRRRELLVGLLRDEDYRVRERAVAVARATVQREGRVGLRGRPRRRRRRRASSGRARTPRERRGPRDAPSSSVPSSTRLGRRADLGRRRAPRRRPRPRDGRGHRGRGAPRGRPERPRRASPRPRTGPVAGRRSRRSSPALEEGNLWLQVHALDALGSVGDPEIAPRLLPLLGNDSLRQGRAARPRAPPVAGGGRAARSGGQRRESSTRSSSRPRGPRSRPRPRARSSRCAPSGPTRERRSSVVLEDPEEDGPARTDAAHLMALLDVPRRRARHRHARPVPGRLRARSARSRRTRCEEALLVRPPGGRPGAGARASRRAAGRSRRPDAPAPLLVHPSPTVKAAVLSASRPGSFPSPT